MNHRPYNPIHDVQIAVDGETARMLGQIARDRWKRAVSEDIPFHESGPDRWPSELKPDLFDVDVGISRTVPEYGDQGAVREVEALYVDAIRAAQKWIYIENQYITSTLIGKILSERLQEREGPEIVLVDHREYSGWVEASTMGVFRSRLMRPLLEAKHSERLRLYYPTFRSTHCPINVHSKVLIVDDCFARVGSSNLSNRSLGLDSECDLAIESNGETRIEDAIKHFRNRLLAEHLGTTPDHFDKTMASTGSMLKAIEKLNTGGRSLQPLNTKLPYWLDCIVPRNSLLDPDRPITWPMFFREVRRDDKFRRLFFMGGFFVLILLGLIAGFLIS